MSEREKENKKNTESGVAAEAETERYCEKCRVWIRDDTERCPLCQHVLSGTGEKIRPTYPDARVVVRKYRFFENLLLFISIVIAAVSVFINLNLNPDFLWCIMAALALFYANAVVRFAVVGKSGYMIKVIGLAVLGVASMVAADNVLGYQGWSLNFGLPIGILVMDAGVLVLMAVNRRNWQSYMMMEIFLIVLSLLPVIFYELGLEKLYYLAFSPLLVSVFLFLGTFIMGDIRARNELKRRFYV